MIAPTDQADKKPFSKGAKVAIALGTAGVLAVAATVGGIAILGPKAHVSTSQGESGNGDDDLVGNSDSNAIVIEIAPESLASLSPERLIEAISIPATDEGGQPTTPEQFAEKFVDRLEAILNAGITEEEYAPFREQPLVEYPAAMKQKYDAVGGNALFVVGADQGGFSNNHEVNLNIAGTGFAIEAGTFKENAELVAQRITGDQSFPGGEFTMEIGIKFTNNAEELGLVDFFEAAGQDIRGTERTVTYTLRVSNIDGSLKSIVVDSAKG